jgi:NitT/TauT family transport system substrate-binding protein
MISKIIKALAALSLVTIMGASPRIASAQTADEVTFALGWLPTGVYAMYFVALDKGFYKDVNLSVKIVRGFGSGDTVKRIAANQADVGSADSGALISAKGQSAIPVKIIAIVEGESPSGLLYVAESGITKPSDLKGRKIARSASGAGSALLQAFLDANKLAASDMNFVVTDATGYLPLLLSRKVDAITEQKVVLPKYALPAAKEGLTVKAMTFSEYGLSFYGAALIANDSTIKTRPDVLRRFLAASFRGYKAAFDNPEEAAKILLKYHPEAGTPESVRGEIEIEKGLILTEDARKNGLGSIEVNKLKASRDLLIKALKLPNEIKLDDLYTASLLPK